MINKLWFAFMFVLGSIVRSKYKQTINITSIISKTSLEKKY